MKKATKALLAYAGVLLVTAGAAFGQTSGCCTTTVVGQAISPAPVQQQQVLVGQQVPPAPAVVAQPVQPVPQPPVVVQAPEPQVVVVTQYLAQPVQPAVIAYAPVQPATPIIVQRGGGYYGRMPNDGYTGAPWVMETRQSRWLLPDKVTTVSGYGVPPRTAERMYRAQTRSRKPWCYW